MLAPWRSWRRFLGSQFSVWQPFKQGQRLFGSLQQCRCGIGRWGRRALSSPVGRNSRVSGWRGSSSFHHLIGRSVVRCRDERAFAHRPNSGLRAVVDPNFPKDRFDMNLHGSLGDGHLACYRLVGITLSQAAQDGLLPNRQPRREAGLGLWYKFIRFDFGLDHFATVTTVVCASVVSVILVVSCRPSVTGCAAAAAVVLPVSEETQYFWREERHAEYDQFKGFDECFARGDLDQIRVGARSKRRHHFSQLVLMSQHSDPPRRIPLLERLDSCQCRIEIIAIFDDEQDGMLLRERAPDGAVNVGR